MIPSKRIPEIDIAKTIGISVVILQHAGYPMNNVFTFLTVFALPLFFILSGAFLTPPHPVSAASRRPDASFPAVFRKKTKRLLLPYLYFSLIDLAVLFLVDLIRTGSPHPVRLTADIIRFVTMHGISVLWFLSALWMGELIFSACLMVKSKTVRLLLTVLLLLLLIGTALFRPALFAWYEQSRSADVLAGSAGTSLALGSAVKTEFLYDLSLTFLRLPVCIFFIALGYTGNRIFDRCFLSVNSETGSSSARISWERLPEALKGFLVLVVSLVFYCGSCFIAVYNSGGNIPLIYYGKNLALYLLAACLGTAGTLFLSRALYYLFHAVFSGRPVKALMFPGEHSLIIMLTHMDLHLITIAKIPVTLLLVLLPIPNTFYWILVVLFTLLVEIPVILLIRRFFPFLLGLSAKKEARP